MNQFLWIIHFRLRCGVFHYCVFGSYRTPRRIDAVFRRIYPSMVLSTPSKLENEYPYHNEQGIVGLRKLAKIGTQRLGIRN